MIDDYVRNRLRSEFDLQETKLKNLFGHIYRDRERAWEAWEKRVAHHGFDSAVKRLKSKPQRFGKLKGRAWFGFLKDRAFKERMRALREAGTISENWYSARLQLENTGERIEVVKAKVEQTLEKEKQRQRSTEHSRHRGRSR